jgi:4-amino-4-deoxy-L-arabinose transferase-like glycosyltransferase
MKFSVSLSTPWLLTILVFCLVSGLSIFADGMFFDGLFYASIANNLANGNGSFWHLSYTQTLHSACYEQPPLTFFLQSVFFRVLGDGLWVERLYCFLLAILMVITIRQLWTEITEGNQKKAWYPVLLWICVPIVSWTYQNNLEEVTMGWFDALAVLFLMKGCKRNDLRLILIGGIFIFLASFCKGLQGLFPIIILVLYEIVFRRNQHGLLLKQLLVAFTFPIFMYSIFYAWPEAHNFYENYILRRLAGTFQGVQNSTSSHFYLVSKLVVELIVPLALMMIMVLLFGLDRKIIFSKQKNALLLLLIGLSASLPLLVTLEQRAFYLTTSIPYFILALSIWSQNVPILIIEKISARPTKNNVINRILIVAIVVTVFTFPFVSHIPKRDRDLIHDVRLIGTTIPPGSIISIPESLAANWNYHAYFMRYDKISLDEKGTHPFLLTEKNQPLQMDSCYYQIDLPLNKFFIFKCE